ncbi:hypothetical protein TNCV_3205081 [Trichonephila clavipes]|nr:hypothetical protein TNCV_3205081 [Trichonephila clavipes]
MHADLFFIESHKQPFYRCPRCLNRCLRRSLKLENSSTPESVIHLQILMSSPEFKPRLSRTAVSVPYTGWPFRSPSAQQLFYLCPQYEGHLLHVSCSVGLARKTEPEKCMEQVVARFRRRKNIKDDNREEITDFVLNRSQDFTNAMKKI